MKADILEHMKRKGTAAHNLTESDIDLDLNYPSDIESRYVKSINPLSLVMVKPLKSRLKVISRRLKIEYPGKHWRPQDIIFLFP